MSDTERLNTALAGRYRVERELGQGGMATVYLAHDLRHDREVAIKVLHPELGVALGGERFLSEIRMTARLQHPHILPLLDSGTADGLLYYVMPLSTGETLRQRLEREKQLPIADALRVAREVADALGYAHSAGIVHRDIKPENILLQGGHAIVADFGIALAVQSAGGERMTQTGLSLGTPQYMSPEQAMGERTIDARSDIYALGAVTYEMLTGDPPFTGSTVKAIVARVLTERPTPPSTLRDTVSPEIENAVLTALAKLPADRFASATEFAAALGQGAASGVGTSAASLTSARRLASTRRRVPLNAALLGVAVIALAVAAWGWRRPTFGSDSAVRRFELTTTDLPYAVPVSGILTSLAISADGQHLVYAATKPGGGYALAIRSADQLNGRVLPGTDNGFYPDFSPDGKWIAFVSGDGLLQKVTVDGTSLTKICTVGANGGAGVTWISNREIVFAPRAVVGSGLYRVSADGGEPVAFGVPDTAAGERYQLMPRAVNGGSLVFYSSTRASAADQEVGVQSTGVDRRVKVFKTLRGSNVLGLMNGMVIYVRFDGALMAAPFDARNLTVGTPIQVGDSIAIRSWDAAAALSQNGILVYQQGGAAGQLVRVAADGLATPLLDSVRNYLHPRLSPDGRYVAFEVTTAGGADIWVSELATRTLMRLTNGGVNDRPEWSADGKRVGYASNRDQTYGFWWQPLDASATPTRVFPTSEQVREGVFTRDGRGVVYRIDSRSTNRDVLMFGLANRAAEGQTVPLLVSAWDEKEPRVSADSRLLAYVSDESGREEVYVRLLAKDGGRVPVSAGGGGEPLWAPDGRHLYYRVADQLMEATVSTSPALAITARRVLFAGPYATDIYHANYDVAPDGRSFVMIRPSVQSRRLVVVLNWAKELQNRSSTTH